MRALTVVALLLVSSPALAQSIPGEYFQFRLSAHENLQAKTLIRGLAAEDNQRLRFDPTEAEYFDDIEDELMLTPEEIARYKEHGLVSVDHQQHYSFASSYYAIYARELPVLITTDSIMHAVHRSYGDILKTLEGAILVPGIEEVLRKTRAVLPEVSGSEAAKKDADTYLGVALALIAETKPETTSEEIAERLQDIESLQMKPIPLWGRERVVDFSQFKPRGHYAEQPALRRYFKTMMWLGRIDIGFQLKSERETEAAVLLTRAMDQAKTLQTLQRMDALLAWIVGNSDNLRAPELLAAAQKAKTPQEIQSLLLKSGAGAQMIRSQFLKSNKNSPVKAIPPPTFQVFGQRYMIDSFVLSKVVFDSILFKKKKVLRMMPSGLDVMAALGNDEAARLLEDEMEALPYAANLLAAREFVDAHPQKFWQSSFVNIWLDALRTLDDPKQHFSNMPQVMRTRAWRRKQLQTQLASWAELRHDTILYAKQSYTAFPACEYPKAYVEPYPEFFARIKFFGERGQARLAELTQDMPGKARAAQIGAYLGRLAAVMTKLESLAYKELAAREFTSAEEDWLAKTIDARGGGSGPPTYTGWYLDLFFRRLDGVSAKPVVADVHTNPEDQTVLEVGVGNATFLVTAIDNEDDLTAYVGPISTYYEFKQPLSNRLTDQSWRQQLRDNKAPLRPEWIKLLQPPGKQRHLARKRR